MKLNKNFFQRNAEEVARDLLGKILVRRINGKELQARIVETEAYFDETDPASRACKNGDLCETMKMSPGTILVYGVHNNWLLNFVTDNFGIASAVLVRALEPLNFDGKCNGPGLLTKNLGIKKEFHKKDIFELDDFWVDDNDDEFEIVNSFRIGIKKDLLKPMRFYIKENKCVSRNGPRNI
jgi:DNA-3-methyladenine glycosylase